MAKRFKRYLFCLQTYMQKCRKTFKLNLSLSKLMQADSKNIVKKVYIANDNCPIINNFSFSLNVYYSISISTG